MSDIRLQNAMLEKDKILVATESETPMEEYIEKPTGGFDKAATASSSDKKRRTNMACTNCRQRHIKCDGMGEPCTRCLNLKQNCIYLEAERKVVISVKYLDKLQNLISKLKVENANLRTLKKTTKKEPMPESSQSKTASSYSSDDEGDEPLELVLEHDSGNAPTTNAATTIHKRQDTEQPVANLNQKETAEPHFNKEFASENHILDDHGLATHESAGQHDNKSSSSKAHDSSTGNEKKNQEVIPPFLEQYGRLIHSRTGERLYIGSSSMTLFGLEIGRLVAPMLSNKATEGPGAADASPVSESPQNKAETETILEKEGNAYRIMLGKTHSRPGINVNFTLPSYSYAMLLVDSFISYNDGCFYFFNEGLVKENLRRIYNDETNTGFKLDYGIESLNTSPQNESTLETIWFCKLLLVFATGEMYLGTANYLNGYKLSEKPRRKKQKLNRHHTLASQSLPSGTTADAQNSNTETNYGSNPQNPKKKSKPNYTGTKLPGSGFFNQASELFTGLFASGSIDNCIREGGIEVLLLYAFYLQVADCTAASYFYFGIALRASLLVGLHVDIGKETLNRFELEHRRRLWWTVYMYERMLASKAGLPLSLTDEDISTELPSDFDMSQPAPGCENYIFPEAEFISNCVKITQINANILRKLYTRHPSSNILPVVHEMVVALLKWKKALPHDINCDYSQPELTISRLVVNMMTEYFQGINLAVRPLLFHFVLLNLKSTNPKEGKYLDLSKYSSVVLALLNASFQASINTVRSLWALVPENMVAMFGYMDREYLFNSTATLVLFNATFGVYDTTNEHLDHALTLFTKMRNLGNHPATLRREQILRLISILDFNGSMSGLLKKHNDNLNPPSSSANLDKSFGHNVTVAKVGDTEQTSLNINPNANTKTNASEHVSGDLKSTPISEKEQQESHFAPAHTVKPPSLSQPTLEEVPAIHESPSLEQPFKKPQEISNPASSKHVTLFNPLYSLTSKPSQASPLNEPLDSETALLTNSGGSQRKKEQQDLHRAQSRTPHHTLQHTQAHHQNDHQFNLQQNPNQDVVHHHQILFMDSLASILDRPRPQHEINTGLFSPSLSSIFNQIDDIPEFEQLSSTSNDMELWKDVTNQAAWLQNDMGDEFEFLLDKSDKH